jgi:hypothetical protein
MQTDRELSRKLVRSTIAQYEQARAAGNVELLSAMREVSRSAYDIETRFEKRENPMTTAMLAIVTAEEEVAKKLYLLALEQNKRESDEESYVWRLYLGRRFFEARLIPMREELIQCRDQASRLGDQDAVREADAALVSWLV